MSFGNGYSRYSGLVKMGGKLYFIWYELKPGDVRSAIVSPGEEYFKGIALIEKHEFDAEYVFSQVSRNDGEMLLKSLARHWPKPPADAKPIYPLPGNVEDAQ